ncbi:MAG: hypothetical protein KF724_09325 [Phycisphaeraceae bacterium]|nr:hypothetical protein [Phycisphaeraceae bacterium]
MRSLISRMEEAVDTARDRRHGVVMPAMPTLGSAGDSAHATRASGAMPPMTSTSDLRRSEVPPAPLPFPAPVASGKPKARAKSLEEFDEAFKRLADRQAS